MHGARPPLPDTSSNLAQSSETTKVLHPKNATKQGNCELTHITQQWRIEGGGFKPSPRNSEGPPKSCQTQPDCENS